MSSEQSENAGYSRSEWTSLSIQDRIKAMNQIQDNATTPAKSVDEPELEEEEEAAAAPISSRSPAKRSSVVDIWTKRSKGPAADESEEDNDSDFVAEIVAPPVPSWKKTGNNKALSSPSAAAATPTKRSSVADLWAERSNSAKKEEPAEKSGAVSEAPKRTSVADLWAQRAKNNDDVDAAPATTTAPMRKDEPQEADLVIEPTASSDAGVSDTIQATPTQSAVNLWKKRQESVEEDAASDNNFGGGEAAAALDWPSGDEESDRESFHQDTIPKRSSVIDSWTKRGASSLPPKDKKVSPSLSTHFAATSKSEQQTSSSSVAEGVKSPPWVTAKRVGSSGGSVASMPNTFNQQADAGSVASAHTTGSGSGAVPPYKQVLRARASSFEKKTAQEVKSPPWLKRHEDNTTPQKEVQEKKVDTVKSPPWVNNKILKSTPSPAGGGSGSGDDAEAVKSPPWVKKATEKKATTESATDDTTTTPVTPSSSLPPYKLALKKRLQTTPPVQSEQKDTTPSWVKKRLEKEQEEIKETGGEEKKVEEVADRPEEAVDNKEKPKKASAPPATKKFMSLAKKWESQTQAGSAAKTTIPSIKKTPTATRSQDSTVVTGKDTTSTGEKNEQVQLTDNNWENFERFDSGLLEAEEWQSFGEDFAQKETVTAESSKDIWRTRDVSPSEKKEDSTNGENRAESPFTAMASKRTNSWQEVETRPSRDTADKITTNSESAAKGSPKKIKPLPSPPKLQWKSQNAHKRAQLREASPAKVTLPTVNTTSAIGEKLSEQADSSISNSSSPNSEEDKDDPPRLGASPNKFKRDTKLDVDEDFDEDVDDPPIEEYPEEEDESDDDKVAPVLLPDATPRGSVAMAKSDERRKALRKLRRTMNNNRGDDEGGSHVSESVYSDTLMPKTPAVARGKQATVARSSKTAAVNNSAVRSSATHTANAAPAPAPVPTSSNSTRNGSNYPLQTNPVKSDASTEVSGFSGASSIPNSAFAPSNEDSKSDVSSAAGFSVLANRASQALKSRRTSRMAAVAMQNDEEYKRELSRKALSASAPRSARRQLYGTNSRTTYHQDDRDIDSPFDEKEDMQKKKSAATAHIPRQTLASRYNTASRFLDAVSSMVDDAKKTFIGEDSRRDQTELNRSLMSSSFGSYETGSTSMYPRDHSLATESQSYFDGTSIEIAPSQSTDYMDGQSMASGAVNTSALSGTSPRRTPSSRRSKGSAAGIQISEDAIPQGFVEESSNNLAEVQEAYKSFNFQQIATDTISEIAQAIPKTQELDELAKGVNDGVQAASLSLRKLVDQKQKPQENQSVPVGEEGDTDKATSNAKPASKALTVSGAPKQDSYDEEAVAIEVEYMEEEGEQSSGQAGKENDPAAAPAGESSVEMDSLGESGKSRLSV